MILVVKFICCVVQIYNIGLNWTKYALLRALKTYFNICTQGVSNLKYKIGIINSAFLFIQLKTRTNAQNYLALPIF